GDLIGAGLLTLYAVPGALAAASVIVDVLIQAATQFLFAIFGLLALIALEASEALARSAAVGIALAALLLAGFYLAQRRGGQRILRAIVSRLARAGEGRVLGARHRKSAARGSRGGVCHPQRARRAGRRARRAVRGIRNSTGAGDCAVARQTRRRSRARSAWPSRLADAGMGALGAELPQAAGTRG